MPDRCDLIKSGWLIPPYPLDPRWLEERLNDSVALEAIEKICKKLINTEERASASLNLSREIAESGLFERVINTLYALLIQLTSSRKIGVESKNLVYREYPPVELKYLEVDFPYRELSRGLNTGSIARITRGNKTIIKYVSADKEGLVSESISRNIIADKIVLNSRFSGTAVFMYDTLISDINLSNDLLCLIVKGIGSSYLDGIITKYMELVNSPIVTVKNVSSSIALLYSRIMPLVELNLIPISINEINMKRLIERIYETSINYSSTGAILNLILTYRSIEQLCEHLELVKKETLEYINDLILKRDLKIAILELGAEVYLGKAIIKIPDDSLIVFVWNCYENQRVVIDNEVLECGNKGIFEKENIIYPENKVAGSIVFIHMTYPASGEIIIKRAKTKQ